MAGEHRGDEEEEEEEDDGDEGGASSHPIVAAVVTCTAWLASCGADAQFVPFPACVHLNTKCV